MPNQIPTINPAVKYRTVSALRKLLLPDLESALTSPIVIQDGEGEPLAVLIPWQQFCELQDAAQTE